MDRNEAITTLRANVIYACESAGFNVATINLVTEALDLAIEALEREIEYGQMVVDFTKGETMKSDEWKYDTTCDAETSTTTDYISRADTIKAMCAKCTQEGYDECREDCTEVAIVRGMPPVNQKQITGKLETAEIATSEGEESTMSQPKSKLYIPLNQHTVERINRLHKNDCGDYFDEEWLYNELEQIAEIRQLTPTERTGEWAGAYLDHESVGVRPRTLYCSECNWLTSFPSAWCPNCGAKMKGGTENE